MTRTRFWSALSTVFAAVSLSALTPNCDLNPQPLPPDHGFASATNGGSSGGGGGASGAGSDMSQDGSLGGPYWSGEAGEPPPTVAAEGGADGQSAARSDGGSWSDAAIDGEGDAQAADSEAGCSYETPEAGE